MTGSVHVEYRKFSDFSEFFKVSVAVLRTKQKSDIVHSHSKITFPLDFIEDTVRGTDLFCMSGAEGPLGGRTFLSLRSFKDKWGWLRNKNLWKTGF